jgi:hypothetical protein
MPKTIDPVFVAKVLIFVAGFAFLAISHYRFRQRLRKKELIPENLIAQYDGLLEIAKNADLMFDEIIKEGTADLTCPQINWESPKQAYSFISKHALDSEDRIRARIKSVADTRGEIAPKLLTACEAISRFCKTTLRSTCTWTDALVISQLRPPLLALLLAWLANIGYIKLFPIGQETSCSIVMTHNILCPKEELIKFLGEKSDG